MVYPKTIVEKNEGGLLEILSAAEQFCGDRFIEGLRMRSYSMEEIQQTTDTVRLYQARMNVEIRALSRFSETFLNQYATDNNGCFETASRLFNRLRSTISATRRLYKKTCPRRRRPQPASAPRPSVLGHSKLARASVNMDLFGVQSLDEASQELYTALDTFFSSLVGALALCHRVMQDERAIRADGERCQQIFDSCVRELMDTVKVIANGLMATETLPANELAERRAKARSLNEFYSENYHQHDKGQFTLFLALALAEQGRNNGLTAEEMVLWRDHPELAHQVKEAIALMPRMTDIEGQKGKVRGRVVVEFLAYCRLEKENLHKGYAYVCKEYKARGGTLELPGWKAVQAEWRACDRRGTSEDSLRTTFGNRLRSVTPEATENKNIIHMPLSCASGF